MALPYPTQPGDVDHMITNDHAAVNRLFEHIEAGRGDRQVLADQICFQVALHADAEERTFYPELQRLGRNDDAEELIAEHAEVKDLVKTVERTEPGEPEFERALAAIIKDIREHANEEETIFLPEMRYGAGAERMAELGEEFLAAKRTAPTYSHPAGPSSGLGHKLADAGAAVIDKLRDKASGRIHVLGTDASGLLDPQAQRLIDTFAGLDPKPLEILKPEQARRQPTLVDAVHKILEADGKSTDPEPVGSVEDINLLGTAGGELPVRIYQPEGAGSAPLPVILWIHGGGFVLYDVDTYDASCRGLVNKTGAIVVSPEYRRAPENVFPAAHDDVLATYRWLQTNASQLGGDPARIAIGGESVGGTLAAATSLQLQEAGEPLPVAQVLVYPLTTAEQWGDSFADAADARPLNRPLLSWMAMHAFHGVPEAATDPRIALLDLSKEELAGLPATLVITDERDVLRSQGEQFATNLETAGVAVTSSRYDGMMHEFFGAAAVLDKAQQAQQEAADHFTTAFRTS
ncbi:alpha/beta hydrolase fold domain-containing protein [Kribbella sp. NBC_00382]|uniref:alpha/beta hydrolase fold domain-containing protein n=1 Tax=Kribbella sp. NBC_00382 TaxID=2975967 RepID=UPI002E2269B2